MLTLKAYPQNIKGYSSTATPIHLEELSDNKTFSTLYGRITPSGTGQNWLQFPVLDAIAYLPANSGWNFFNTDNAHGWSQVDSPILYGDSSTLSGAFGFTQGIEFNGVTSGTGVGSSGIYQELNGLVVGNEYEICTTMETQIAGLGVITYGYAGDDRFIGGGAYLNHTTNNGTHCVRFTAQSTTEILSVQYDATTVKSVRIAEVSVKSVIANSMNYSDIYEAQVILDLDVQSIPLTLSVDNFKNASEKTQSYSHQFNLPSTKNNNKFFYNYFDVTVSNDGLANTFNPHKKTKVTLAEDGVVIFEGFLKLSNVKFKEQIPFYSVHVHSDVVSFKETLEDRKIKDLDLTELEHTTTADNIENSWIGELELDQPLAADSFAYHGVHISKTDVIKYPLCDWKGEQVQLFDGADLDEIVFTDLYDGFRPFLKVKYLVDRIFNESGFTYESNFFNEPHFSKLYMDFSHGEGLASKSSDAAVFELADNTLLTTQGYLGLPYENYNWDDYTIPYNGAEWNMLTDKFTCVNPNQSIDVRYSLKFSNQSQFNKRRVSTRIKHVEFATGNINLIDHQVNPISSVSNLSNNNRVIVTGDATIIMNAGDTVEIECRDAEDTGNIRQEPSVDNFFRVNLQNIVMDTASLLVKRGDMNQWDFIKTIFTAFNLIAMPTDDDNTLSIEPYNDIFSDSTKIHDWTMKEDIGQRTVEPLDLKKLIDFSYTLDKKDSVAMQYKEQNITSDNHVDGEFSSYREDNTLLNGLLGTDVFKLDEIAPTVNYYLTGTEVDAPYIPHIYEKKDGESHVAYDNKPRILYDNGIKTSSIPYSTPFQNSLTSRFDRKYSYLQFNTEYDNSSRSLCFGSQILGDGTYNHIDNIYNQYWGKYIDEMYNTDTRVINTYMVLNADDISSFSFSDRVRIKNREFRVNRIDYRAGDISTVELILIP